MSLCRSLYLDEPAGIIHHHVHVRLGFGVLGVVQVQHRLAPVDPHRNGGDLAVNRIHFQLPGLQEPLHCQRQRHVAPGNGDRSSPPVRLQDIAVDGYGALSQGGTVDHRSQTPADQPLDLHGAAILFSAHGLPKMPGMGGARQHAVFGRHPAFAATLEKPRHACFHARRDQHPGTAVFGEHGALCVGHEVRDEPDSAHFVRLATAGPERRLILHFRTSRGWGAYPNPQVP